MSDFDISVALPERLPEAVTTPDGERELAGVLCFMQDALDRVEEKRTAFTQPANKAIKEYNAKAKEAAEPFLKAKEAISSLLGQYRASEAFQSLLNERRKAEQDFQQAVMDEDMDRMKATNDELEKALVLAPKSVQTQTGKVIRYRSDIVLDEVDESRLPERYFARIPDTKAINDDLKNGIGVEGVRYHIRFKPAVYNVDSKEE